MSCRTSQGGLRLYAGWKSFASQEEGRAEFTEDRQGEHIKTERLGDSERRERESRLCSGSGVLNEGDSLVSLSSQASRNWSEPGPGLWCPPEVACARGPGVLVSRCLESVVLEKDRSDLGGTESVTGGYLA